MTLPSPLGHGPARKGDNLASPPAPSARNAALAHLAPERRERDHGRAIFLTGPFVSTRTVGRVSLNSDMGSKPEARPSAFQFQSARPSRAACAGRLRGSSSRRLACRRFQFLGRVYRAVRTRLSVRIHSASRVRQNPTPRTIEQLFHFHSLSAGSTGLAALLDGHQQSRRKIANVRKAFGEIRNVER